MKIRFFKVFAPAAMLAAEGGIVPVGAVFVRTPPPLRKKTRSWVSWEGRLRALGWNKRLCMGARQMEAPAARRCGMGPAQVAPKSRRIYIRSGRLAVMESH